MSNAPLTILYGSELHLHSTNTFNFLSLLFLSVRKINSCVFSDSCFICPRLSQTLKPSLRSRSAIHNERQSSLLWTRHSENNGTLCSFFSSGKLYLNNLVNMPVLIHYFLPHHDQACGFNEANRYFCSDCLSPRKVLRILNGHICF